MSLPLAALSGTSATATTSAARPSPALLSTTTADPSLWLSKRHGCPQLREYCPRAFGTWAIFPQLREKGLSLTIDLDASHYLHIISDFYRASTLRFGPFWISMRKIYKDWYWKPKSLMYVIWTLSILHTIPGVHITYNTGCPYYTPYRVSILHSCPLCYIVAYCWQKCTYMNLFLPWQPLSVMFANQKTTEPVFIFQ